MMIDATPLVTGPTLHFDWAVIADGSRSAIELTSVGIDLSHPLQDLALWTAILIGLRLIAKVGGRPDLISLLRAFQQAAVDFVMKQDKPVQLYRSIVRA